MQLDAYRRFTERLVDGLAARGEVQGLVALGSMAERGELPDDVSDHDFFVVVEPAHAERYRASDDWLPDPTGIALRFRETAHGVKVVYADGHLLEYAVFTLDELALARVNRYRVLLDRADVAARMAAVAAETAARLAREAPSDEWLAGLFLSEVLVAALRAARGELQSGDQRLRQAKTHLLRLVARHVPSPAAHRLDGLDASRRVELAYPALARALETAARMDAREHALALLAIAAAELAPRVPGFPQAGLDAVRARVAALPACTPSSSEAP